MSLRRLTALVLVGFAAALGWLESPASADLTKDQAIELLAGAVGSIRTFDVHVVVTTRQLIVLEKAEPGGIGKPGRPASTSRKLAPGELPITLKKSSRQVFSKGKGRIELLGPRGEPASVVVYDHDQQKALQNVSRTMTVRSLGLAQLPEGTDYRGAFMTWLGKVPLARCLRERARVTLRTEQGRHILEGPPEPGRNVSLNSLGVRVTLDPARGYLPASVDTIRVVADKHVLWNRREVRRWKELPGGSWAPVTIVTTNYAVDQTSNETFGAIFQETVMEVDVARSTWNRAIADSTLDIAIPAGTRVIDGQRNVTYVTGKQDAKHNLDDLAASAKNLVPLLPASPPPQRGHWRWGALGGAVALIMMSLAYFVVRRRRALQS